MGARRRRSREGADFAPVRSFAAQRSVLIASVGAWTFLATGLLLAALRAAPSLQMRHQMLAVATSVWPWGVPLCLVAGVLFAATRVRGWPLLAIASVLASCLHVAWLVPYWEGGGATPPPSGTPVSIATTNLRCNGDGGKDLAAALPDIDVDILVVQGGYESQIEQLRPAGTDGPFSAFYDPIDDHPECGTFVFSTLPVAVVPSVDSVSPVLRVDLGDQELLVFPIDMPTPSKGLAAWVEGFSDLERGFSAESRPLVAAGDFNAVLEHQPMRQLLASSSLRDAARDSGSGWQPTFRLTPWTPPVTSIDHVLVSDSVAVRTVRAVRVQGQNHELVVANLSLRAP